MSATFSVLLFCILLSLTLSAPVVWIGGVTSSSFSIHIDIDPAVSSIILSTSPSGVPKIATRGRSTPSGLSVDPAIYKDLRRLQFNHLKSRTKYYVLFRRARKLSVEASVRTFPREGDKVDIALSFAGCQWFPKLDHVFGDVLFRFKHVEQMEEPVPFFFLHMGDFHYQDITDNEVAKFEAALRPVLERPRVHNVFSRMPVPYMYDDHDYGANNAAFNSPSREAALKNYRSMVPSYPLPTDDDASYHAFTVGSVRFIITDLRANAERTPKSMLGLVQRKWMFKQLEMASMYDVVVWVSVKPWIGKEGGASILETNDDSWAAFPEERRLISDKIAELGITNMVMIAGDAHMLAIDNGTNSDYSGRDDTPAGFPVFQGGPIGHIGSAKGGPYSEGCNAFRLFPNFQYGLLNITQVGKPNGPCVEFLGLESGEMKPVMQFKKCGQLGGVKGSGGQDESCPLELFPPFIMGAVQDILVRCGLLGIQDSSDPNNSCPLPLDMLPPTVLQLIQSFIRMLLQP